LAVLVGASSSALAQGQPALNSAVANANTIGVISGGADGTYIRIAADLANVLDGDDMRILPIIGRGSLQNLRDIMFLRGVDIGIVQMDAREQLKAENLQNYAVNKLRYIARLYNEEIHVLASREISDLRQLDGKKVNIDKNGSGTNLTARILFDKLGIKPEFTTFDQGSSYERLKAGEIQALIVQDPMNMGYLAVKTMLAHIAKETVEKVIDTGSKAVNKENMESAEIKALLTPDLKSYLDE